MKAMFPQSGGGDLMQQLRAHGREVALIAGAAVLLVALVVFRGAVRSEYRSLTGSAEAANDPAAAALAKARARRQALAKGATTGAAPAAPTSKPGAKGTVVATASKAAPAQAGAPSKVSAAPGAVVAKTAAAPAPTVAAPNAAGAKVAAPNAAAPNAAAPKMAAPDASAPVAQAKVPATAQKRPATAKDSASGGVMREVYGYTPDARRDPFNSLLKTGDLRPTLGELRLLGILYDETGRHPVAILRDASNTQYRITTGQQLGRMRVARIKRKVVVFTIEEFGMNRMDSLVLGDSTKARAK